MSGIVSRLAQMAAAVLVASIMMIVPARADAIDGEWCREGRSFKIEGPSILTMGGTRMTGDYNRHGFRYTVPQNETEAGTEISMRLISEEQLELFRGTAATTGETWRRCKVTS